MANNNRCSVLLPTFNSERFIRQTLESVLNQTYRNHMILAIDDNSSDKTFEILREYQEKNPDRMVISRNSRNFGVGITLKTLLQKVETPYVAWIGHDDLWAKDFLESQLRILEQNENISVTFSNVSYIDSLSANFSPKDLIFKHDKISRYSRSKLFGELVSGNFLCAPASVFRFYKETDSFFGGFNDSLQDYEMWLFQICKGQFYFNQGTTTYYRIHNSNYSLTSLDLTANEFDYLTSWLRVVHSDVFVTYYYSIGDLEKIALINGLAAMAAFNPLIGLVTNRLLDLVYSTIATSEVEWEESDFTSKVIESFAQNGLYRRALKHLVPGKESHAKVGKKVFPTFIHSPAYQGPILRQLMNQCPFLNFKSLADINAIDIAGGVFILEPDIMTHFLNNDCVVRGVIEGRALILSRNSFKEAWQKRFPDLPVLSNQEIERGPIQQVLFNVFLRIQRKPQLALGADNSAWPVRRKCKTIFIEKFNRKLWKVFLPNTSDVDLKLISDGSELIFRRTWDRGSGLTLELNSELLSDLRIEFEEDGVLPNWIVLNQTVFVLNALAWFDGQLVAAPGFQFYDTSISQSSLANFYRPIAQQSDSITISWQPAIQLKRFIDRHNFLKRSIIYFGSLFGNLTMRFLRLIR